MKIDQRTINIFIKFHQAHDAAKKISGEAFAADIAKPIRLIEAAIKKHALSDVEACHHLMKEISENETLNQQTVDVTIMWLMAGLVEKIKREAS